MPSITDLCASICPGQPTCYNLRNGSRKGTRWSAQRTGMDIENYIVNIMNNEEQKNTDEYKDNIAKKAVIKLQLRGYMLNDTQLRVNKKITVTQLRKTCVVSGRVDLELRTSYNNTITVCEIKSSQQSLENYKEYITSSLSQEPVKTFGKHESTLFDRFALQAHFYREIYKERYPERNVEAIVLLVCSDNSDVIEVGPKRYASISKLISTPDVYQTVAFSNVGYRFINSVIRNNRYFKLFINEKNIVLDARGREKNVVTYQKQLYAIAYVTPSRAKTISSGKHTNVSKSKTAEMSQNTTIKSWIDTFGLTESVCGIIFVYQQCRKFNMIVCNVASET